MNSSNLTQLLKLIRADNANTTCILTNKDGVMTANATSADESLISTVILRDIIPIKEVLGIKDIDKLIKILSAHESEVDIKFNKNKLLLKDPKVNSEYAVARPEFINMKHLNFTPSYNGEVHFTEESYTRLIKTIKVMSDSQCVGIVLSDEMSTITVGSMTDYSHKMSFTTPSKSYVSDKIYDIFYLNLQIVKQLVESNSSCKDVKVLVCMDGLVTFTFNYENLAAEYHLIMMEV